MQAYLSYRRQDAFDLLGVPEDAALPAHRGALARLRPPLRALDASRGRRTWRRRRATCSSPAPAPTPSSPTPRSARRCSSAARPCARNGRRAPMRPQIKTDLLDPEVQYRKGRAAMDAGKLRRTPSSSSSSPPTATRRTASTAPSSPGAASPLPRDRRPPGGQGPRGGAAHRPPLRPRRALPRRDPRPSWATATRPRPTCAEPSS